MVNPCQLIARLLPHCSRSTPNSLNQQFTELASPELLLTCDNGSKPAYNRGRSVGCGCKWSPFHRPPQPPAAAPSTAANAAPVWQNSGRQIETSDSRHVGASFAVLADALHDHHRHLGCSPFPPFPRFARSARRFCERGRRELRSHVPTVVGWREPSERTRRWIARALAHPQMDRGPGTRDGSSDHHPEVP